MDLGTTSLTAALEQLRLRLLDLTGRNRLINLKHTPGKAMQFVQGTPAELYAKLVEGNSKAAVNILGLPEPLKRDWIEKNGRLQRPEPREWAAKKDIPLSYDIDDPEDDEGDSFLRALLYPDDLAKHLRKIEREANLAIEETGANMLFLVLGFLEFPDQKNSDKNFVAPLICLPVSMSKKEVGGEQQFSLQFTGDDISDNLSLREKLRNDFGLHFPELDDEQIDVEAYFEEVKDVIDKRPNFSFRNRVSLCLLSFSNMLLVRDLDPSKWPEVKDKNALLDHPIVREVFEGSTKEGAGGIEIAKEHDVESGEANKIALVYDADSSQHSALVDALILKKNLVIEGPPGTGKSQTITNLIAASIAEGKKVLFIAEKLTALQVVKNRLSMAGLAPFVLELHSNKTSKKKVLEEITERISYRPRNPSALPGLETELETHRKELREYTALMNTVAHNALGLTVHQLMWRAEKHRSVITEGEAILGQMTCVDSGDISSHELARRADYLKHLGSQYRIINGYGVSSTFWGFTPQNLIPGDEIKIKNLMEDALSWASVFKEHVSDYALIMLGVKISGFTLNVALRQSEFLDWVISQENSSLPLDRIPAMMSSDNSGDEAKKRLLELQTLIHRYFELEPSVKKAVQVDEFITLKAISELKSLRESAHGLGVELKTLPELVELHQDLVNAVDKLIEADANLSKVLTSEGLSYTDSFIHLIGLQRFLEVLIDAPVEAAHLQSPAIFKSNGLQLLEEIKAIQDQWVSNERELTESLYLDALPSDADIKGAISVFREGDAWYRIFQGRWREATRLHKSISRSKVGMPASERLRQLENLIQLIPLKEKWRSHTAWRAVLDISPPAEPYDFDEVLALARWNKDIKSASEAIGYKDLDCSKFDIDGIRSLQRAYVNTSADIKEAFLSREIFNQKLQKLNEFSGMDMLGKLQSKVKLFCFNLEDQIKFIKATSNEVASYDEIILGAEGFIERTQIKADINANKVTQNLLGHHYQELETDVASVLKALDFAQEILKLEIDQGVKSELFEGDIVSKAKSLKAQTENIIQGLKSLSLFTQAMSKYGDLDIKQWTGASPEADLDLFSNLLVTSLSDGIDDADILLPWSLYIGTRAEAVDIRLSEFVELLEEKSIKSEELSDAYSYAVYSSLVKDIFRKIPRLASFTGTRHSKVREDFKSLDAEVISLRGAAVGASSHRNANPPYGSNGSRVDDKSEMVLLNYLMPQQRPRMPVRKILQKAGRSIQELKPCFMMGPQAVAQYLTPGSIEFDLVIMDEASQLKPEEAIGAIARGKQLVVVGDPKQLPPTSFFSKMSQGSDEEEFTTTDAESILDVCSSHFHPIRSLRWHYRSQHHSLIAFSNKNFYRSNLIVFPSPYGQGGRLGVRAFYLADAIYENNSNLREAKRVVDAVVEHILSRSDESLGVVTLNIKQRDLISELVAERLNSLPEAGAYKEHWQEEGEPLFIKTLENVQGDERDAIIISTTFGRPSGSSVVRQNFGPISKQGGWRRLNVLFTRAKKSVTLYTSLRPDDIVMDGTTPDGTKALRNYLEYARTGSLTVAEDTGLEPDSDFEISVIDMLKQRGYEVTPQLGVAGYRIDIAVKHPKIPGCYLAAIECDGATYHSALSVRDRDRIRQEILESLGWRGRIWRIWSTDWFRSPRSETEKLISFLNDLSETWRPEHTSGSSWIEEGVGQAEEGIASGPISTESNLELEIERDAVSSALIADVEYLEVEVGDVINYVDLNQPADILTVQITDGVDNFENGIINEARPLAKALLGAVQGDEIVLHLAGGNSKRLHILEINKHKKQS
jgi:superfamily I DNA and/or RNA helicase/transcription elongation GreA/GreB family factor/very-short-patch-repair endonuclease